jgi:ribonuclease HI
LTSWFSYKTIAENILNKLNEHVLVNGITIVTDGGCLNNQFPASKRHMYGSMAVFDNGIRLETVPFQGKDHTRSIRWECDDKLWIENMPDVPASNNVAELQMLIKAMVYLQELAGRSTMNTIAMTKVRILMDSQLVIGFIRGNKCKSSHLIEHVHVARKLFSICSWKKEIFHVENAWVKTVLGH